VIRPNSASRRGKPGPDVRFGSEADITLANSDVRLTPAGSTDRRNTF
jgi:hypothetical protein